MIDPKLIQEISQRLADEGKIIEAGFAALRAMAIPRDAPQIQIDEMRMAYMAGAQHLFSCIMVSMDPGKEPTEKDMERIDLIHKELEAWRAKIQASIKR